METSLISVIVPCYNQAEFLPDTLRSVLAQTYSNWECILVNDGSTDSTEAVCTKWCDLDSRFKLINKPNGGLASARNSGIKAASGEWIQFLDSDDVLLEDKLSTALSHSHSDIIVSSFRLLIDKSQEIVSSADFILQSRLTLDAMLYKWDRDFTIPIHCALFKKSSIPENGFREDLRAKEDWVFWVQVFLNNPEAIYLDQPLVLYRVHEKSMTKNKLLLLECTIEAIFHIRDLLPVELSKSFEEARIKYLACNLLISQEANRKILGSFSYRSLNYIARKFQNLKTNLKR